MDAVQSRAALQGALLDAAGWLLFALGYVGALAFVVTQALAGRVTPGQVLMAVALAGQVHTFVRWSAATTRWFLQTLRAVERYLWILDYAEAARPRPADPVPVPGQLVHGIACERVSFRYPGTNVDVVQDLDLQLPAGATVALVGENGAGKTTLVKLLCRFYEPTSGRITVDGVDLRRFAIDEWRAHLAAGFQDFVRFELLAREAVGVGDLPRIAEPEAVGAALARAGAAELPAQLPHGLETALGTSWEGGVDLSLGQWQKLAVARALMRERPLVLILDEPTASLDAESEQALFARFHRAACASGTAGSLTLLVSHRFSTVRMADLIVVLDRGRVVELGTHQQLLSRAGLYAELFAIQAAAYR
jgi:ATP-binding cassette subfamily B protein